MIKWYKYLYMDEQSEKKIMKITKRLENEKPIKGLYCILLPTNPDNLFDIIPATQLYFPYYKRRDLYLIGLGFGKESAVNLLLEMVKDIDQATDGFDARHYYLLEDFQ